MLQPEWRPEEAPIHRPGADRQSSCAIFRRAHNVSEREFQCGPRNQLCFDQIPKLTHSDLESPTADWTAPPPSTPSSCCAAWPTRDVPSCAPSTSRRRTSFFFKLTQEFALRTMPDFATSSPFNIIFEDLYYRVEVGKDRGECTSHSIHSEIG